MSDFAVFNSQVEEANANFRSALAQVGRILEELNSYLRTMGEATQNKSVPLWQELQTQWNGQYHQQQVAMEGDCRASMGAHDAYKEGDQHTVRVMSG